MNAKANYVRSRLSLRKPQSESLEILQELTDVLELKKNPDLAAELSKVQERHPICADFERDFVSICFALATGVGKPRLTYCSNATSFTTSNGGTPWKYLLIPHDAVMHNMSFDGLASRHEVRTYS